MHSSDFMLIALMILLYINIQQLLTDTYLTNSKLTIYIFQKDVYIFKFRNAMSNDIIHHEIDTADSSRTFIAMGIGKSKMAF